MKRPTRPSYHGIYRDLERNRFEWDSDQNPSPMRSDMEGGRLTEHIPVLCAWCGRPFWPAMHILEGLCSPECQDAEAQWHEWERARREALGILENSDLDGAQLMQLLGRSSVV